jgi:hypothetical protein
LPQPGALTLRARFEDAAGNIAMAELALELCGDSDAYSAWVVCGDECVDLWSDPQHCDACFNDCGQGGSCSNGNCCDAMGYCGAPLREPPLARPGSIPAPMAPLFLQHVEIWSAPSVDAPPVRAFDL